MSLGQVNRGLNILGQGAATAARMAPIAEAAPALAPEAPAVFNEPKLGIAWGDFHQGFFSSARALFTGPFRVTQFLGGEYFRDCWVERRVPKRAVLAAALWHIFFVVSPFSLLSTTLRHNPAFDHTQLTWSGPIEDFPLLDIRAAKPRAVVRDAGKAVIPKSAEAAHPRQRIVTDPVHPNHPRQTLIHSAAPKLTPQIAPALPNIVQLQGPAAPARPHVQISAEALAKLRPRAQHKRTATATAPPPDFSAMDAKPSEIQLGSSATGPARPKMDLNASAAPRLAERAQRDSVAAPDLEQQPGTGTASTLIALSAAPAPPKPDVQPPAGNLAAHVAMSPEGKKPAEPVAGGSANGGEGKSDVGVSISGSNPQPKSNASGSSGAGRLNLSLPSARTLMTHGESQGAAEQSRPPNFSALPPGAKPEEVFASKRVYTVAVNMANINSASGSWILHFAEMGSSSAAAYGAGSAATPSAPADLALPVPLRKVDPKYPPDLIDQNVQGEVVLYAVVHADGSVGGIQVAGSLDPQLDANAKAAFAQWKFTPASKAGNAVDVQVIAHIPFKISDDR
jgi:TonB family protein